MPFTPQVVAVCAAHDRVKRGDIGRLAHMPPLCVIPHAHPITWGWVCERGAMSRWVWRPASNEVPAVCPGREPRIMHMPDVHWNIPE